MDAFTEALYILVRAGMYPFELIGDNVTDSHLTEVYVLFGWAVSVIISYYYGLTRR